MNSPINEELINRDKENKKKLSLIINGENKYKNKYIQKNIFKKKYRNNLSLERNKSLKTNEKLTKRNLKKNYMSIYYRTIPKKSQSVSNFSYINNSNKLYRPLGPYNYLINGGGGFCTKISNNNNNNSQIKNKKNYKDFLNKFINKKNIIPYNDSITKFHIKQPYNSQNIICNTEKNKNKYKTNYMTSYSNKNKNNSNLKINPRLNIDDANRNITYFKLNKKIKNNISTSIEEKRKKYKYKNKNKKINYYNEDNHKIFENEHFSFDKISTRNKDTKDKIILIKQSNIQFSMNNFRIKAFNQLCQIENIILSYYPSLNKNNINQKITKSVVCPKQAEINIIMNSYPKKSIKENENNKNVIININQISQISPKITRIQKESKEEIHKTKRDFNEEDNINNNNNNYNNEDEVNYKEKISDLDKEIKDNKIKDNIKLFDENEYKEDKKNNKEIIPEINNIKDIIEFKNNNSDNNINRDIKIENSKENKIFIDNQSNEIQYKRDAIKDIIKQKNNNNNETNNNNDKFQKYINDISEEPKNLNETKLNKELSIYIETFLKNNNNK